MLSGGGTIEYLLRDEAGRISALVPDAKETVAGSSLYPRNEHGKADPSWFPRSYVELGDFGPRGLLLVLPSFFDPDGAALARAISEAAGCVRSRPGAPLLLDVRGNTGGSFLRTLPLIDAIMEGAPDRRVGVLVDKFTFSAAIVFVALLKHRLGTRLELIGEEMGDGLTFFAEGGTIDLSTPGAVVRYASALHDWAEGRIDDTTPSEIAAKIVPVGKLDVDRAWTAKGQDAEALDRFYGDVLASLAP